MEDRFEITRVTLRHYRSIARCDVPLGHLSVLVGPNGAGKSNFLDALRLVSDALQTTLDNALRDRGGVAEVRRRSTGHPTHFQISLQFTTTRFAGTYEFQVGAVRGGDFALKSESCHVHRLEMGGSDAHFTVHDGVLTSKSVAMPMPAPSADRLYLVGASGLDEFRPVYDGLSAIGIFSLNPEAMRRPQSPDGGEVLRRDGSNVASVIARLQRESPAVKRQIEDYLSAVVPGVRGVQREQIGSWETLSFQQDVPGAPKPWAFQAPSMSDGTLRALGVLAALFGGSRAAPPTPIGIEEPEAALHPAAMGALLDALRDAATRRQVLATTHSPDLLDFPDIDAGQLLAVRADSGQSVIERIDSTGRKALRDKLFTAGELLRADQLQPDPAPMEQDELFA